MGSQNWITVNDADGKPIYINMDLVRRIDDLTDGTTRQCVVYFSDDHKVGIVGEAADKFLRRLSKILA